MTFETETFLPTAVSEPLKIILPFGLIGLGELREFTVEPIAGSWPFLNLRSHGDLEIEFLAIEAQHAVSTYPIALGDEDAGGLGLTRPEDALIFNLVTVHSLRPQFVTVNLAGPIVVNRRTLLARQIVLSPSEKFSASHPLIDERSEITVAAGV